MPELPEVECFRRYLSHTALHRRIDRVEVTDGRVLGDDAKRKTDALRDMLEGTSLEEPWRHGKWLFALTAEGGSLAMHFGKTGHLKYLRSEDAPSHSRALLYFQDGSSLAYVCPRMFGRVAPVKDVGQFLAARGVGPDALELDREAFARRLSGRRGAVKSALMNQAVIAGLGNIYADEALFQAGVHPKVRSDRLSDERMGRLFSTMRRVLRTAIQRGADARDMPESWLIHRRDADQTCPRCGRGLRRTRIAQRSTYYCPNCQH